MNVPENLKYSKDHEWVRQEGEFAFVGITDFAQSELGEIVIVDITTEGETLTKDDVFGSVEAVKTVSDLLMPIGGEVLEFNSELENAPELINSEPYDKGWLIKIRMSDVSEIDGLLDAAAYKELIW